MEGKQANTRLFCYVGLVLAQEDLLSVVPLSSGRHAGNLQPGREDERSRREGKKKTLAVCTNHSTAGSLKSADRASVLAKRRAIVGRILQANIPSASSFFFLFFSFSCLARARHAAT